MANDRIFIRCDGCGAWKMLMKYFPGSLSTRDNNILVWLDAHGGCHPNMFEPDLAGVVGFSLHTESQHSEVLDPQKHNALPPEDAIKGGTA